jgi:two-component system cell cycle response regulator DivK
MSLQTNRLLKFSFAVWQYADLNQSPKCKNQGDGVPRILLVEDNEMNRDMLSRRLERKNYSVDIAVDGQAGVNMASTHSPDLILMDLSLPIMDGWEAIRTIKSDSATSGIPIIALTAHAMAGDEARAREAGCDDYDTKPVNFARLIEKMTALLPAQ